MMMTMKIPVIFKKFTKLVNDLEIEGIDELEETSETADELESLAFIYSLCNTV